MPTSGYHLDLSTFSLAKLKKQLKRSRLLPSQQILQESIEERFACLEQHGIENLEQLQRALKTKSAIQSFAEVTGLPVDYLTILRREVNSSQPKPIDLKDFPGIDSGDIGKLQAIGIKNTEQLFPYVLTPQNRDELAQRTQIAVEDIMELTRLTDVARAKWVGPKFARLLIESAYNTVRKIAQSNAEELYFDLVRVNKERGIYQGKFGAEDMRQWIDSVQDVPQVIQY
jgi:hypothetical protein